MRCGVARHSGSVCLGYDPSVVSTRDGDDQRRRLAAIAVEAGLGLVASTVEHRGESRHISASLFDEHGRELGQV